VRGIQLVLALTRDDDVHGDGRDDETSRRIHQEGQAEWRTQLVPFGSCVWHEGRRGIVARIKDSQLGDHLAPTR